MVKNNIQLFASYIGSGIIYLTGGIDKMFIALCLFLAFDYITGVMKAIKNKKLSSKVGFSGLAKKVIILIIVCVANIVDVNITAHGLVRNCIILFYICNEGISIIENAGVFDIPIPQKLKDVFEELKEENNKNGK